MIRLSDAIEVHAKANDSDPFASRRLAAHIRQGLITQDDLPGVMVTAGYAIGQRRIQAKSAKTGEFVSMRRKG